MFIELIIFISAEMSYNFLEVELAPQNFYCSLCDGARALKNKVESWIEKLVRSMTDNHCL